ncbi:MAG: hypothetical protein HXX17_10485 [Geobacteraceae bacterium]|nr:hypothetical protein [Geobacteraceae bacterium]
MKKFGILKSVAESVGASRTIHTVLAGLILFAAAFIRIVSANSDLWFDEIWSLHLIKTISSPLGIFTSIHHDNNHYLNSLFMYIFSSVDSSLLYRAPAVLAGVGSVAAAGLIGKRQSITNAVISMLLMTFSYLMVLYSSEARGYAFVVFFSLLSFYLMLRYMEERTYFFAILVSLSMTLGFASHLTFLNFFAAAAIWSCYTLARSFTGIKQAFGSLFSCYALPIVYLILVYVLDISQLGIEVLVSEKTPSNVVEGLDNAFKWATGFPFSGHAGYLLILVALSLLAMGLYQLQLEKSDQWPFFFSVIILIPVILAIVRQPSVLYPRYFLVPTGFFLLLIGQGLSFLYNRGRWGKILTVFLITLFITANGEYVIELMKFGRGQYSEAVRFLKEKSVSDYVVISDERNDPTIALLLQYYSRKNWSERLQDIYWIHSGSWADKDSDSNTLIKLSSVKFLGEADKFGYDSTDCMVLPKDTGSRVGPEWMILWRIPSYKQPPPPKTLFDKIGNRYDMVKSYRTAQLSGYSWYIFHNNL